MGEDTGQLTLFAVGDDDQNIYGFNGASVEFIRRFEEDYNSKPSYLTANYRSTAHIIAAANAVVAPAQQRMKAEHPIDVDRAWVQDPPGGPWETVDPVARGRVQLLPVGDNPLSQAQVVMGELLRLKALAANWDWSCCAVGQAIPQTIPRGTVRDRLPGKGQDATRRRLPGQGRHYVT